MLATYAATEGGGMGERGGPEWDDKIKAKLKEIAGLEQEIEDDKKLLRLISGYTRLIERLWRAGRNRYKAQWAVIQFLIDAGAPMEAAVPLMQTLTSIVYERKSVERKAAGKSGSTRPYHATLNLAFCAAVVTSSKERGRRVSEGLRLASRASGLEQRKIRSFRDNLNRGIELPLAVDAYDEFLASLQAMSDDEFSAQAPRMIADLREICYPSS